jgi:hypothetical protein
LKRVCTIFILAVFSLAVLLPFSLGIKTASAQESGYSIQNVDHQIQVMYSGDIVVRDTITVTGQISDGFLIGFPYEYGSYVLKGVAFDSERTYPMSMGVGLGDRSLFYGVEVTFPNGSPQVFTVVFILSNDLLTSDFEGFYRLSFPAYPSFVKDTAHVNVTFVIPQDGSILEISKDDGTINTNNFVKDNLAAFAYFPAVATFTVPTGVISQMDIGTLNRIVTLGPVGEIAVSDTYSLLNNSTFAITSLILDVPPDASNIVGKDEFGRTLVTEVLPENVILHVLPANLTLASPLAPSQSALIAVTYSFPSVPPDQTRFALNLELVPSFDYYVNKTSVTIIPPEGAHIVMPQLSSADLSLSLGRELFQETLTISRDGVSYIDSDVPSGNVLQIAYDFNSLWLSLRPTMIVWALAAIGSVVMIFFWRRPRSSMPARITVPKLSAGLGSDQIRAFIEAYDERTRISSELRSLVVRAQKGKIPRRQYKVQRRALELRRDVLSKNITELKSTFRSAGGNYAALVKQFDTAENELNRAEGKIRNAETRQRIGELSVEEYKKSIADLQRQKEKAEATINGILLRLREEIR